MTLRSTKIVATLGPATEGEHHLKRLITAGIDAVRLNFSHGGHEEYSRAISQVRAASAGTGKPIAIIADLQGPKIRVGDLGAKGVNLVRGQKVTLSPQRVSESPDVIPVSYSDLAKAVRQGSKILLDDGRIALKVLEVDKGAVSCRVSIGGLLTSRKGINLPGESFDVPSLTGKDLQDLEFALFAGVDYIALSFVRTAADVLELRRLVNQHAARRVKIIAKIEKHEAIRNISDIVAAADAVMVARGDLGVEIPPERVPYWQKEVIRHSRAQAKPVITATQMLESMITSPAPTRAEASDVANAVYDGTDAVMLSGETAVGKYPAKAVETMHRIARTVEASLKRRVIAFEPTGGTVTNAISAAACELADSLEAKAIVTPTSSGTTALEVSKHRPRTPVVAVSSSAEVVNQLALVWGVHPFQVAPGRDTDDMFVKAIAAANKSGLAKSKDKIVITAGVLVNVPGTTNLIKVHLME